MASGAAAIATALIGLIELWGWWSGVALHEGRRSALLTMAPNTAAAFVLCGFSLWLLQSGRFARPVFDRAAWLFAWLVTGIAVVTLAEYVTGVDWEIDRLLIGASAGGGFDRIARMASNSAAAFLLIGVALLTLKVDTRQGHHPAEWLALAAGGIALVALVRHLYDIAQLHPLLTGDPTMSLSSVAAFLLVALGVLAARPDRGIMALITSDGAGGLMARQMLMVAIIVPLLLDALSIWGGHAGWYDMETQNAVHVALTIGVFGFLVLLTAHSLKGVDARRRQAETETRELNAVLERRVIERTAQLEAVNQGLQQEMAERRTAEERLRASEASLAEAQRTAQLGNWDWNIVTNGLWWSDEIYRIFGLTPQQFAATYPAFLNTIHPEDRASVEATVLASVEEGVPYSIDHRIVRPDGTERVVHEEGRVFRDNNGRPERMIGTVQDITERKRAEEALRMASAYNRSLIEASLDPLVTISVEGKITDVNEASVQATGVTREQLICTDFSDYFTEPDKAREGYQQVFTAGLVRDYPLAIRHVSGRVTEVLYNASVYRDAQGQVRGVFASARDITERKRAEEVVRAERQRFADVLDKLPAYLVLLTPDYHVPFANRFFRERFGESRGRRCYEYLFNRAEPCDVCETYSILKTNAPHHWEWTGPDHRNYDIYDFPFTDTDGSPLIMEVGLDITERKVAEEEIRKLNAELEQRVAQRTAELAASNKELEAFAYSVSHDLRAPLRGIDGFSQILIEDYGDKLGEEGRDSLQRVRASSQRMALLIDDLLKLSRITRSGMHHVPVDLGALAGQVAEGLRQAEPGRQAEIVIAPDLRVVGDHNLLLVALDNLLGNAWKFTRKQPAARIEVGVETKGGDRVYFVRDNGAGFDMKYADKLFGAFQRLHSAQEYEGTGIGLATVQRVIHRHGGRVWAEGEAGRGAAFYFTLPVHPANGGEL